MNYKRTIILGALISAVVWCAVKAIEVLLKVGGQETESFYAITNQAASDLIVISTNHSHTVVIRMQDLSPEATNWLRPLVDRAMVAGMRIGFNIGNRGGTPADIEQACAVFLASSNGQESADWLVEFIRTHP